MMPGGQAGVVSPLDKMPVEDIIRLQMDNDSQASNAKVSNDCR